MADGITPVMKLTKPEYQSTPWDEKVNGNFDIIDGFMGTYLNIPNFMGAWANSTSYFAGQAVLDTTNSTVWSCQVPHISAAIPTTFLQDRLAHPTYWTNVTSTAVSGIPEAPIDNTTYGRQNALWVPTAGASALNNYGRNLLRNALFVVQQRGAGPFVSTTSGYTADQWVLNSGNGDTATVNMVTLTDSDRAGIGDQAATTGWQVTFTGSPSTLAQSSIVQRSGANLRSTAGKTLTYSFWAKCASGTRKVGINILQYFGTGGAPSAQVRALSTGASVTVTTTWTRYQATMTMPSVAGKVFGTNNNYMIQYEIYFSSGTNQNAVAGNIGVQSGTITFWGMQLENANAATQLEKIDLSLDIATCKRAYQTFWLYYANYLTAGTVGAYSFALPEQMRNVPTIGAGTPSVTNLSAASLTSDAMMATFSCTAAATGAVVYSNSYNLVAEL